MTYVIHFCKGTKEQPKQPRFSPQTGEAIKEERCNRAWLDVDKNNAGAPPTWKYCAQCVSEGYVNPANKPINQERSDLARKRNQERRQAMVEA